MWTTVALLSALSLAPNDAGTLKIDHLRSTHGILGPARASETYVPGDALTLNFDINGITVGEKGKVAYSIAFVVKNLGDNTTVVSQKAQERETLTVFGGNRVQGFVHLDIGTEQPAGDYSITVTATDVASKATQEFTHKFTVVKPKFALVRLLTSSDREGQSPVPALGEGQALWFHFGIVGFGRDTATKQPKIQFEFDVLDIDGKSTIGKPFVTMLNKEVPDKSVAIPMQYPLTLTREGKYTLVIILTDEVTKQTDKLSIPLNVLSAK